MPDTRTYSNFTIVSQCTCSFCGSDTGVNLVSYEVHDIATDKTATKESYMCIDCFNAYQDIRDITLDDIMESVGSSFEDGLPDNFESFWDKVDVQNAYEDGWEKVKSELKPLYARAFYKLKGKNPLRVTTSTKLGIRFNGKSKFKGKAVLVRRIKNEGITLPLVGIDIAGGLFDPCEIVELLKELSK